MYFIVAVLTIPIFFLWRVIFRKSKMVKLMKYTTVSVLTIITAPVLYIGIIAAMFFAGEYYPDRNFDAKGWKHRADQRYEYAKDIVNSKLLIGKSENEVIRLLGKREYPDTTKTWGYELGFRPEIGNIDPDVLYVEFKDGRVVEVRWRKSD